MVLAFALAYHLAPQNNLGGVRFMSALGHKLTSNSPGKFESKLAHGAGYATHWQLGNVRTTRRIVGAYVRLGPLSELVFVNK
jgi:hypothetical protein